MNNAESSRDWAVVPLFPLPNVVLFPRAILSLHIFEERYKAMTADAIAGDCRIAIALLRPGWEKDYERNPPIEPVVCVGRILTWEKLPNGKYNFVLQGCERARVLREVPGNSYRVAELTPLRERAVLDIDLEEQRRQLHRLFTTGSLAVLPAARNMRELLSSPLSTTAIADLVAFNFLEDNVLKQKLLGEEDVRRRVNHIVEALQSLASRIHPPLPGFPSDPGFN